MKNQRFFLAEFIRQANICACTLLARAQISRTERGMVINMGSIGGNTAAVIQIGTFADNDYGNDVVKWENAFQEPVYGFLDMVNEGTNSRSLMHRVEDADYIFLCDYFLPAAGGVKLTAENSRVLIDGEVYEVKAYDDPMRMHEHMEIYLKYLGGQQGNGG